MDQNRHTIDLPEPLLRAAREVAAARDITLGQLIRDALNAEIRRSVRVTMSPDRAEERRLAVLRARYAEDFAYAANWPDLQERLKAKGVHLREAGGGLAVASWPGGARLCKASDLGASITALARRFRAPFPGDRAGSPYAHVVTTRRDEDRVVDTGEL